MCRFYLKNYILEKDFLKITIWISSNLSELTPMMFNIGLTYLDSETPISFFLVLYHKQKKLKEPLSYNRCNLSLHLYKYQ